MPPRRSSIRMRTLMESTAKTTTFVLTKGLHSLFRSFHAKELPIEALFFLIGTITIYAGFTIVGLWTCTYGSSCGGALTPVSFGLGIPVIVSGWSFLYLKYNAKYNEESHKTNVHLTNVAQNFLALSLTAFLGLRLLAKVRYGACNDNMRTETMFCNTNAASKGLPEDNFIVAVLLPMTFSTMMRDLDVSVTVTCNLITTLFLVLCVWDDFTRTKGTAVFMFACFSLLTSYSNQKQNVRSFLVQQQLAEMIKQNEEMAQELRANELRHMIGNVAHDLKTPLASFVSGLDMIADIAQEGLEKLGAAEKGATVSHSPTRGLSLGAPSITPLGPPGSLDVMTETKDCLEAVISTVRNNRSINNFMMMTINRCIDYTKASKGLKLVPKFETIDLMETLSLPFKCMRDVAQKVRVNLEPLSSEICSHVITDKQWLQENILCLLSNAVKYSAGGTVNGRVRLTTAAAVGPGQKGDLPLLGVLSKNSSNAELESMASPRISDKPVNINSPMSSFYARSRVRVVAVREANERSVHSNRSIESSGRSAVGAVLAVPTASAPLKAESTPTTTSTPSTVQAPGDGTKSVLLVEVEDTGIGMTEESMASLFNAFKQAQSLAGGTGLGLFSLARRIEALGGVYGVKKRADGVQGSLFWFTVPYRPDEQFSGLVREHSATLFQVSDHSSRPSPLVLRDYERPDDHMPVRGTPVHSLSKSINSAARIHTNLRILIVDDSPSIQKMMSMMLRRHGHVVDQADNGANAVTMVTQAYSELLQPPSSGASSKDKAAQWCQLHDLSAAYDVVLMDLQMPIMDGLEAMRRIRKAEGVLTERIAAFSSLSESATQLVLDRKRTSLSAAESSSEGKRDSSKSRSSLHIDHNNIHHKNTEGTMHQLILGVSANSDTETIRDALQAGADAFLPKPFSIDSFYAALGKCRMFHNQS